MARWKMLVGKVNYKGNRYKAGDIFEAPPEDVRGMRDQLQPLDRVEESNPEFFAEPVPRKKLVAVHRGFGKWDVVNTELNQNLNDHPLTKDEAKQLANEMEKQWDEKLAAKDVVKVTTEKKVEVEKEDADDEGEKKSGDTKTVARKRRVPIGRGTEPE